jgi:exodeoxyribonuclease V alpha subunit
LEKEATEFVSGIVERITYQNHENGFVVLRVKVARQRDLVTITGEVPSISVGEEINAQGRWINNLKHGLTFKAQFIRSTPPNSIEGIEKYLGSGLIKGIGKFFAKKLVQVFGMEVFDIIENSAKRLTEVDGIGKIRAERIARSFADQKVVREIMVFLQSNGVSTARATRIYKTYGEEAIKIVSENPYRLAKDIRGIGFLSADKIARNLGISEQSPIRARAGINFTLLEALNDGHCGLPKDLLLKTAQELLNIPQEILCDALQEEINEQSVVADTIGSVIVIFLVSYYVYEKQSSIKLKTLNGLSGYNIDHVKAVEWVEQKLNMTFADNQKIALEAMLKSKVCVITGGPGTGKTTIMRAIIKILMAKHYKISLCAPTGRAAKRLSETTGVEALTIHRMLKFDPIKGGFQYNENYQLKTDVLIVDEASMLDVQLLHSLLKAIPNNSSLIFVGDVDQLPSVGAGQVLRDIIDSDSIVTVRLNKIFRQKEDSQIITNAHLINKGMFPQLESTQDFSYIETETPEETAEILLKFMKHVIAIGDVQVLCPMQRGSCGARSLNVSLQKLLNQNQGIERYGQLFAVNDRVMQVENNYDKEVYNGDLGFIKELNYDDQVILVDFDNRIITYSFDELDELTIAYAITIHKSQGSEYQVVIIPITTQSYMMLQRNLLYTAVTRGKKKVVLIGQKKAIAIAVKNASENKRYTKLKEWLRVGN